MKKGPVEMDYGLRSVTLPKKTLHILSVVTKCDLQVWVLLRFNVTFYFLISFLVYRG